MKRNLKLAITLAGLAVVTQGCISGNAKRFFAENKDYDLEGVKVLFSTPWGTETITADKMQSHVVYPYGTKNLPAAAVGATNHASSIEIPVSSKLHYSTNDIIR